MIIREVWRKDSVQVFGVYWVGKERFYWVIPYEGYGGLMALSDREIDVVDPALSNELVLCKDGDGGDMILHWAAVDLIDELVERDPLAMIEFLGRINN